MCFQKIVHIKNVMHSVLVSCADAEGWTRDPAPLPLKNHKNIGFLGPDTLKNHKATKPTFNVGPSSAR